MGKRAGDGTVGKPPPKAKAKKTSERVVVDSPAGESFNSGHLATIAEIIKLIREHDIFEEIDAAPPLDYGNGGREAAFDISHFRSALKAEKGQYKCAGAQLDIA